MLYSINTYKYRLPGAIVYESVESLLQALFF